MLQIVTMSLKPDLCVVDTIFENIECHDENNYTTQEEDNIKEYYTLDEAVDLTGHGLYNVVLLVANTFSLLGLTLDMFAISSISSAAACDLQLTTREENILMLLPFIGALLMAYPWGYISDIYGRRRSLLVGTWTSFIVSCLAAFSPHWIMLAVLKFISACGSSCTQSVCTLLGESCPTKLNTVYIFIATSIFHIGLPFHIGFHYFTLTLDFSIDLGLISFIPWRFFIGFHYFTLTLDFSIDLGLISFIPWRFLVIMVALPIGISAVGLLFVYESPKFLANAGKEDEAIEILSKIWQWNRQSGKYPVQKLVLTEKGRTNQTSDVPLLQSLWNQAMPLFKAPLLWRTVQLYFLVIVVYGSCGGLFSWFPFLTNAFISGLMSDQNQTEGLCNIISQYQANQDVKHSNVSCHPKSDLAVVVASLAMGIALIVINCIVSFLAYRKKFLMITILLIPSLAALGCITLPSNIGSLIFSSVIPLSWVGTSILSSYFVDLYPTSYRGMMACLSLVAARGSNLMTTSIVGALFIDHCSITFLLVSALLFSGAVVSCFLPADKPKKSKC